MSYILSLIMPTVIILLLLLNVYQGLAGIYVIFYWLVPAKWIAAGGGSTAKINEVLHRLIDPLAMPLEKLFADKVKSEKVRIGLSITTVFIILAIIRLIINNIYLRILLGNLSRTLGAAS